MFLATMFLLSVLLAGAVPTALPADPGGVPPITGFRDVHFGTRLAELRGMEAVETLGPQRVCYERGDEDLRVGDGAAQSIRYCFFRDVLEAVVIVARGERNTAALLDLLQARYGPGQRETRTPRRVLWPGRDASAYYGEPRSAELAQARLWSHDPGRVAAPGVPDRRPARDPHADRPPPAGMLQLNVPQRVRRGLVAQVTVRYRDVAPPATVEVLLPPDLVVQSAVPEARVEGDVVVWENLDAATGTLKLKILVAAEAPVGAAPLLRAAVFDGRGGRSETSATMRVR